MEDKWYSNGLSAEEAKKLKKSYARVGKSNFGINDRDVLALQFGLRYEDGSGTFWQLTDSEDIYSFLKKTQVYEVSKLEGKVVEAFHDGDMLKGLSVNENLI